MPHVASLSIAISGVSQGLGAPFRRRMAALRLRQSEYTDFTSERTQGWRNGVRVSLCQCGRCRRRLQGVCGQRSCP